MKNQKKVFQSLTLILQFGLNMIVPIVLCMMFGIWLGRKYDILWITIPFFCHRGIGGFHQYLQDGKKIYGLGRKDRKK